MEWALFDRTHVHARVYIISDLDLTGRMMLNARLRVSQYTFDAIQSIPVYNVWVIDCPINTSTSTLYLCHLYYLSPVLT